ncbi:MAG: DUF2797 domain-containing protein [Bacteroidales bacterium]|nr:DUF2797 domain-containing protein [Bacteroidales bacterium]
MKSVRESPVSYFLPIGEEEVLMNELLNKKIRIKFKLQINCIKCGRKTNKSFAQGFCYPCFISAPETEECVLRPDLCKAHKGIACDMEFAATHCLIDHFVYIAYTGSIKVGVTRHTQIPTRWIDQGATAAITIVRTPNRYTAGLIEVALKKIMADKTNWRNMLKDISDIDLSDEKLKAQKYLGKEHKEFCIENSETEYINYPVLKIPDKVKSISLDKTPVVEGILTGIKGQYLIFENGEVLNIRKHGGYLVELSF